MSFSYTFICKFKVFKYTYSKQGMIYSDSSVESDVSDNDDDVTLQEITIDNLIDQDFIQTEKKANGEVEIKKWYDR